MTDEEMAAIDEHYAFKLQKAEQQKFELLAFVIQRFCGGKIEFNVEDIMSAWARIDVQRTWVLRKMQKLLRWSKWAS